MPLFGSSKKSPLDLCKALIDGLSQLEKGDKKADKASEEVSKSLLGIKNMMYGSAAQEPQAEVLAQLAQEFYNNHILWSLVKNLAMLDFEARKDACQIFNHLLRRQIGHRSPTVDYVQSPSNADAIIGPLIMGYEQPEVAMVSGQMLRECIRYEPLAKLILTKPAEDPDFYKFFTYVEMSTFDIASDAFSTFKDLLTTHKTLASEFLERNYDRVFPCYRKLLDSENYVTKRQALKLLGELLLDRHNYTTMTKYISNPDNLKLMMNLLREKSRNIQFEAFHVFKVFVANPSKPEPILVILNKNKDKLVDFLQKFHTDRSEDEQFNDEKAYLIKQIKELGN